MMSMQEFKCFGPHTPSHPSTVIQEQLRQDVMTAKMLRYIEERAAKLKTALEVINYDRP